MTYEQIDTVIGAWVKKHNFTLFTGIEGSTEQELRAVYLSSTHGECCQISIAKPKAGKVTVHARDIETRMDEEIENEWVVPISELEKSLEDAVSFVHGWFQR